MFSLILDTHFQWKFLVPSSASFFAIVYVLALLPFTSIKKGWRGLYTATNFLQTSKSNFLDIYNLFPIH